MITATATATEMQNNFGRYLNLVMSGQEIIVTKNGREVGRFIPKDAAVSYLTDSLMQFIDVITHAKQKNLQFCLRFPTEQKSLEFIIIFQYPKCSLHLD